MLKILYFIYNNKLVRIQIFYLKIFYVFMLFGIVTLKL